MGFFASTNAAQRIPAESFAHELGLRRIHVAHYIIEAFHLVLPRRTAPLREDLVAATLLRLEGYADVMTRAFLRCDAVLVAEPPWSASGQQSSNLARIRRRSRSNVSRAIWRPIKRARRARNWLAWPILLGVCEIPTIPLWSDASVLR